MLSVGARFGPYEILAPIGAGGMGDVYRAKDVRLNREIAGPLPQKRAIEIGVAIADGLGAAHEKEVNTLGRSQARRCFPDFRCRLISPDFGLDDPHLLHPNRN